jgi:hypothetical protein
MALHKRMEPIRGEVQKRLDNFINLKKMLNLL